MKYVDGFVLAVPKRRPNTYRRMTQKAVRIWREHGALEDRECTGDDLQVKMGLPFPEDIKAKPGETVIFAYIVFESRAHRGHGECESPASPTCAIPRTCRLTAGGCSAVDLRA